MGRRAQLDAGQQVAERDAVDTGADPSLASDLLAVQLGIDLDDNEGESTHAVGGGTVTARYRTVQLRLHPPNPEHDGFRAWEAPVGFVGGHTYRFVILGTVGFLDQWTGTASRFEQSVAI